MADEPCDFGRLLHLLSEASVEFIVVGGVAAAVHGAARATYDLDISYCREPANIENLIQALAGVHPYLRGVPAGLPFRWDAETIRRGLNFTLVTDSGPIDLLGEITGGGSYEDLRPYCARVELFGISCLCVTLPKLIVLKRAAGRRRDNDALAELEVLLEELRARDTGA